MKIEIEIPDGPSCQECKLRYYDSDYGDICNLTKDDLYWDPKLGHAAKSPECPNYPK
jgi:hypothetical protein